jgi:hypothetical protein
MECLPDSALPAELRQRFGYDVREAGEGERILAGAVVERFVRTADGELHGIMARGVERPGVCAEPGRDPRSHRNLFC